MPKPTTAVTSLLGLAVCGGVIWVATTADPGTVPVHAAPPPSPPPSTAVVAPPSGPGEPAPETGQERVASLVPLPPVTPPSRAPATAGPAAAFPTHQAAAGPGRYRARFAPWAPPYPPPEGTSPREYYLSCLRGARSHGASQAELTCQYLAASL